MNNHVIHIVSSLLPINIGIWNVVSNTLPELARLGFTAEIWTKDVSNPPEQLKDIKLFGFGKISDAKGRLESCNPSETLVVTHGNWSFPTELGNLAKKAGLKWCCYPHGMLEPWSMNHKALKKKVYFNLIEKPRLQKADRIIAVGRPEFDNLERLLPSNTLVHIPNGIEVYDQPYTKPEEKLNFLYMARLHAKKRPFEFLKSWADSPLSGSANFELTIAGPDEGEYQKMDDLIQKKSLTNVVLSEPVYGEDKTKLLDQSHFFVLPSQSEGFPTTIIESMTHGCIPLITEGCNFPESIEAGVALDIGLNHGQTVQVLEKVSRWGREELETRSQNAKLFADDNYSIQIVAGKQKELFDQLLGEKSL